MITAALTNNPRLKTAEELIREIFVQRKRTDG
jgi:hypothetical protein